MHVIDKRDDIRYEVFDIVYDSATGYPHFLIYKYGQWMRMSAKHFTPFNVSGAMHAKWEDGDGRVEYLYGDSDDPYEIPTYRCSACKGEEEYGSDYCPNCWARMDLEG